MRLVPTQTEKHMRRHAHVEEDRRLEVTALIEASQEMTDEGSRRDPGYKASWRELLSVYLETARDGR